MTQSPPMVRVQSYFPKPLLEDLKSVAKKNQSSLAEIIRIASQTFVKQTKPAIASGASTLLKSSTQIGFQDNKHLATQEDKFIYG